MYLQGRHERVHDTSDVTNTLAVRLAGGCGQEQIRCSKAHIAVAVLGAFAAFMDTHNYVAKASCHTEATHDVGLRSQS